MILPTARVLLVTALLAACQTAGIPQAQPPAFSVADDGWFPNERLFRGKRDGHTPEGYGYTLFNDGSGNVRAGLERWSLDCTKDAMTDARNCTIVNRDSRLFVYFSGDGEPKTVCVVGHDFPRRTAAIRVDSNPPVTTNREGCLPAARVMPALLSGERVTTRRVEWPYDHSKDSFGQLLGFSRAIGLAKYTVQEIDGLDFQLTPQQ